MKGLKYLAFLCLICLVVLVGLDYSGDRAVRAISGDNQKELEALPVVGSLDNLKQILEDVQQFQMKGLRMAGGAADVMLKTEAALPAADSGSSNAGINASGAISDYSQTNVQVQGVDEADTVKTDGEYIYKISNNKVIVTKAYPAQEMQIVSTLDYGQEMFPMEMYVDSKYLTVILNQNYYHKREAYPADGAVSEDKILPFRPFENSVKVLVYDLSDRTNLKQIREVEIDGSYLSSRKIENNIYLVNNKYIPVHLLKEQPETLTTPAYKDSADGGELKRVGYEAICYFPGSLEPNYLIIASINLDAMSDKKTELKTYLGSGQSIYSSLENLYVAVPEYKYEETPQPQPEPIPMPEPAPLPEAPDSNLVERKRMIPSILPIPRLLEENTSIYKFNLDEGEIGYQGKGSVSGTILNQFSMDEYKGYFRIATTVHEYTTSDVRMKNNLFTLDKAMNITGKIENIAPGERIYSVRFMGDRGYMVTFKTVDPLFVLDLKDPNNPSILGELKIPGYSNYLQPYDENHIIGFGKDALEVEEPHWSGQGTTKNAYYLGMKVALFDVSDVNNPVEKFKVEIGDRGTESELFWNHKALLFDKEKGVLAFPITVSEIDPATVSKDDYLAKKDPRLAYGMPVFQGAFVYRISAEKGFELKGTITHQPSGQIADLQRTGRYDYNRDISRSLYIGETLYTISNGYIKANDLNTLGEMGGLSF